ncbi:NUDIX domain-containing protein [Variovorax sp. J22R24]|uniref:NUDIX domain-containing protein n=1 Tax=Variovorax gracilis TaxID=3053502 RepID=UPI0025777271|nr:NUDIX domain-containing protein [Variovorax sp. J22R24]MDM0105168.1 NUDIX domain-containing protein [Variovorax sp. J22R24]
MTARNTPPPHGLAVLIGRFQPFHNGHLSLLKLALEAAPRVVVVIGSAFQALSPKHPFNWQQRAEMIRNAVPEADRLRLSFAPVRDYFDETRWVDAVRREVAHAWAGDHAAPSSRSIALVGHFRDATREYLRAFPDWTLLAADGVPLRRASAMRDALFAAPAAALTELAGELPAGTVEFLRGWSALPQFEPLAQEAELLRQYEASWAAAPYPPVLVTVDCVVKCRDRVLLIRRGQTPGKGLLAVPGGFLEQRETTLQAALRELEEETHLALPPDALRACLKATDVFDQPDRSARGRTITHGHFFDLGERDLPGLQADDDAAAAEWTPVSDLCGREDRFLDDHFQMLDHYLGLLQR